jgi:hypothetical protein
MAAQLALALDNLQEVLADADMTLANVVRHTASGSDGGGVDDPLASVWPFMYICINDTPGASEPVEEPPS